MTAQDFLCKAGTNRWGFADRAAFAVDGGYTEIRAGSSHASETIVNPHPSRRKAHIAGAQAMGNKRGFPPLMPIRTLFPQSASLGVLVVPDAAPSGHYISDKRQYLSS